MPHGVAHRTIWGAGASGRFLPHQFVLATGTIADTVINLVGVIGRHVLAQFLPQRRARAKDRIVKRVISKYNARVPTIDRATCKATISINLLTTDP